VGKKKTGGSPLPRSEDRSMLRVSITVEGKTRENRPWYSITKGQKEHQHINSKWQKGEGITGLYGAQKKTTSIA